ncbi:mCG147313 [Mus musculus]|nr:mCG147313 [Mus musculus]
MLQTSLTLKETVWQLGEGHGADVKGCSLSSTEDPILHLAAQGCLSQGPVMNLILDLHYVCRLVPSLP